MSGLAVAIFIRLLLEQFSAMQTPTVSHDGYIRLSLKSLSELPFTHLSSDFDKDILTDLKLQTVPARDAGFSEWSSDTVPAISVGWSWFIHTDTQRLLAAPEAIRSNVMLVDAHGYDLGKMTTSYLFATWLAMHAWQREVADAVALPVYGHC